MLVIGRWHEQRYVWHHHTLESQQSFICNSKLALGNVEMTRASIWDIRDMRCGAGLNALLRCLFLWIGAQTHTHTQFSDSKRCVTQTFYLCISEVQWWQRRSLCAKHFNDLLISIALCRDGHSEVSQEVSTTSTNRCDLPCKLQNVRSYM